MHTSLSFLAFAAAACLAAASTCALVADHVSRACTYVRHTVLRFLEVALAQFEQPALQACAYALGLAKRDRQRVTTGWGICSSP